MFGVHVGAFHGGVMRIENTEITRSGQAGRCVVIGSLQNCAQADEGRQLRTLLLPLARAVPPQNRGCGRHLPGTELRRSGAA